MMDLISEQSLQVLPESIEKYTQLAHKYLRTQKATLEVLSAGTDESGQEIFGICLKTKSGNEEWYDPQSGDSNILAGWDDRDVAQFILENKLLPNLGYFMFQKDLRLFHANMKM